METQIISEQELLNELLEPAKKKHAFQSLLKNYSPKIYYFLRRMGLTHEDADELLQDVFIKFWRTAINQKQGGTIKIALYRLAATDCLIYLAKHTEVCLPGITSEQLLIVVLKCHAEFDFADIAQIISIPVNEVRLLFKMVISNLNDQPISTTK